MDTREFSAWGQNSIGLASLSTGTETFLVAFSLCYCIENWVELGRTFLECIPLICFLRWSAAKVIFYWGNGIWNDNFIKISITVGNGYHDIFFLVASLFFFHYGLLLTYVLTITTKPFLMVTKLTSQTPHMVLFLVHVISVISVFNFFFSKKNKKRKINFDTVAILKFCERENEWHRLKLQEPHRQTKITAGIITKGQGTFPYILLLLG